MLKININRDIDLQKLRKASYFRSPIKDHKEKFSKKL